MMDDVVNLLFGDRHLSKCSERKPPKNPKSFSSAIMTKGEWKLEKSNFMDGYFMRHPKHGCFLLSAKTEQQTLAEFESKATD